MKGTQTTTESQQKGMRTAIPFTKLHGLGNDFVVVDERDLAATPAGQRILDNLESLGAQLAQRVCDRHFGIGADGLIVARQSRRSDCNVGWMYFNSDGSISLMCGNGLRCLALWAHTNERVQGTSFTVETAVGAVPVQLDGPDSVTTDLGEPILGSELIPVAGPYREPVVQEELTVAGRKFTVTCVGMGNPHCVIFDCGLTEAEERHYAPLIQEHAFFPESVNVEFVRVQDAEHARVFVWERGCGPTLACASGAAAVLVAGVLEGRLRRSAEIALPGGSLHVSWKEPGGRVEITGAAKVVYTGVFDLAQFCAGAEGA